MKSLRPTGGYTILEVLIVLAITGGLLISAMTLISGQQRKTEFTTAARDFENRLQDIFNDVETGFYASNGQLKCQNAAPGYNGPTITNANAPLGTNEGCIFLGKALRFYGADGKAANYEVYTIAGKRQWNNAGQLEDVTTLDQANPKLFYTAAGNTSFDRGILNSALTITDLKFVTGYGPPATYDQSEAIAILSGIVAKDADGKNIASADSRSYLASIDLPINTPRFADNFPAFLAKVNTGAAGITARPQGLVVCLSEGAGGRVAAVGIGVRLDAANNPQPSGNRLASELFLDNNASRFGCTP